MLSFRTSGTAAMKLPVGERTIVSSRIVYQAAPWAEKRRCSVLVPSSNDTYFSESRSGVGNSTTLVVSNAERSETFGARKPWEAPP
jgi:hypothetical protein